MPAEIAENPVLREGELHPPGSTQLSFPKVGFAIRSLRGSLVRDILIGLLEFLLLLFQ